jgi:hypothetical protein
VTTSTTPSATATSIRSATHPSDWAGCE